jgi:hypothetical protein
MALVFSFEIEHPFSQALYKDPRTKPILEKYGFHQQHRANQVPLYSDARTVQALQEASPAVRSLFESAGWGANRHDQTNLPDNFQNGKNEFLKDQFETILDSGASETATRYALLELFDWTRKLALGDALKKARMAKAFRLYRCPVVEG